MKKILSLNFFPAFTPPASGGELRYFHMYSRLSENFDVTLLSPTHVDHEFEIVTHSDTFREYRIPKEESIHNILHHRLAEEGVCSEVSALACALSSAYPNAYHRRYLELCEGADVIVHESPYMLGYDLLWRFDNKPRIYNSYNVEYRLMKQLYRGKWAGQYLQYIFSLEKKAALESDILFATSDEEKKAFLELYGVPAEKIKLAPNGIDPDSVIVTAKRRENSVLFLGSHHPPNVEAAEFLVNKVARRCPGIDFLIAGSCGDTLKRNSLGKNVHLLGRVDEKTKKELLSTSQVAVNPMFSGAGTNLKTLEFLSAGLPLLSSDTGVRGLSLRDGEHYLKADKDNFAKKLINLIGDDALRERISRLGRLHVNEKYSWRGIAESVRHEINALPGDRKGGRKLILVLNDFSASKPSGGGEMRINRLYGALSRYHDVASLCLSDSSRLIRSAITRTFTEISFPKTQEHVAEESRVAKLSWIGASDIVSSYMCVRNQFFLSALKAFYRIADLVVLSHPYMSLALESLRGKPLIYEALNFEFGLKNRILRDHPLFETLVDQVRYVEKTACKRSSLFIGVSGEDVASLAQFAGLDGKPSYVVENGVDLKGEEFFLDTFADVRKVLGGRKSVLFIGSGHSPNVAAVNFIANELAPALPHHIFLIVGTVGNAFRQREVPKNVLLFGRIDEEYKKVLLRIADVAINPMIEGSGSNLKLPEYLAYRLPTVTTKVGARGYDVEDGKEVIICELREFADKIDYLLGHDEFKQMLSGQGYAYALRKLDWNVLAENYLSILEHTFFKEEKKKLLVLTYRFTTPPLGGAEVYLLSLLREIDRLADFSVTVATLDIRDILNKYHFSAAYTFDDAPLALPDMQHTSVYKFRCKGISDDVKLKGARRLFRRWMEEFVLSSLRHIDAYTAPLLMGGWNFPERADGRCEIWSSEVSYIYVAGTEEIEMEGYCPHNGELSVLSEGEKTLYEKKLTGKFHVRFKTDGSRWIKLRINPFTAHEDPRPLGVRISSIKYWMNGQWYDLDLNYNYRDFLKEKYLEEYIEELIRTAGARPREYDALFQHVRGPLSPELEGWLDRNVAKFDIVLGHSIPFSTSVLAATFARKYEKPLIMLPHFHMDDEFYHWKSYYEALTAANAVLASPSISIDLFFNKIGAKAMYLPGGIDSREHEDSAPSAFSHLYNGNLPFFLVLGRKAGSKNYKWAMDALQDINRDGKLCNLVLIGKDEDGERIDAGDALYLHEQPRDVVLGALKECMGLINMSESESFGLVLLEAWMEKKPVIVYGNCAAFAELVDDRVNGLLANRESLADKIRFILEEPAQAAEMGRRGFQKVQEQYTWEAIGKEVNNQLLLQMTRNEQTPKVGPGRDV